MFLCFRVSGLEAMCFCVSVFRRGAPQALWKTKYIIKIIANKALQDKPFVSGDRRAKSSVRRSQHMLPCSCLETHTCGLQLSLRLRHGLGTGNRS